jgi:hypothetical protein
MTQEAHYDRDETRGDVIYYEIPDKNTPVEEVIIPSLFVASSKNRTECPIATVAQWYNPAE